MPGQKIRVAIVHDWLVDGGAELVVEQLHRLYPDAPIYTSYATREWQKRLDGAVGSSHLGNYASFCRFYVYGTSLASNSQVTISLLAVLELKQKG